MIIHTVDSYPISVIVSLDYVVQGYYDKSMSLGKPGTYVQRYTKFYICM